MVAYIGSSLSWRALKVTSAWARRKSVQREIIEFSPNLLYAKVRSWDCSPSLLQIDGR
jgi:hypothetical protein